MNDEQYPDALIEKDIEFVAETSNSSIFNAAKKTKKKIVKKSKQNKEEDFMNVYSCGECLYKAKNRYNLRIHEESKHEGVCYSCDHCGYRAKWKKNLKQHVESQHEGVRYSCVQCDYRAKLKQHLLNDM